jgi:hypothetical protein
MTRKLRYVGLLAYRPSSILHNSKRESPHTGTSFPRRFQASIATPNPRAKFDACFCTHERQKPENPRSKRISPILIVASCLRPSPAPTMKLLL